MTSCNWPRSPPKAKRDYSRATRRVRDATPVGFSAGRSAREPPSDVWSFYAERRDGPFPYRWRGTADYGPSKFGRYADDPPSFTGRRVDLLGRSLHVPLEAEPTTVLRDYLSAARTTSAKELAKKAVVLISPEQLVGKVVWPEASPSR